ncbi:glycosyltransferase family 25 protein [Limnohabitans sp. DCL3]|uniref:glycosyltransferase family 25 protein n=1 Tax=Limnohabitans sp. DCL3 TaxID=3374103 RepID=UPI003A8A0616
MTSTSPPHGQTFRVFVINLESQTARWDFQQHQLASRGLSHERVIACDKNHPAVARQDGYWDSWQRPLLPSERACLLSHQSVWEIIAQGQSPGLVLEDDVVLSREIAPTLALLAQFQDVEHISLETRGRKKLLSKQRWPVGDHQWLRRLYLDRTGAAAYVLWPAGAQRLLAESKVRCGLADAMICGSAALKSYQLEPAAAIQSDQCERYRVPVVLKTTSSITPSHTAPHHKNFRQKLRRITAQLEMAWRQCRRLISSQRDFVGINAQMF